MVVCGVNVFSVYGPVPTGFLMMSVAGSAICDHRCFGTIAMSRRMRASLTNCGRSNTITAWLPFAVEETIGSANRLIAGVLPIRS